MTDHRKGLAVISQSTLDGVHMSTDQASACEYDRLLGGSHLLKFAEFRNEFVDPAEAEDRVPFSSAGHQNFLLDLHALIGSRGI